MSERRWVSLGTNGRGEGYGPMSDAEVLAEMDTEALLAELVRRDVTPRLDLDAVRARRRLSDHVVHGHGPYGPGVNDHRKEDGDE